MKKLSPSFQNSQSLILFDFIMIQPKIIFKWPVLATGERGSKMMIMIN